MSMAEQNTAEEVGVAELIAIVSELAGDVCPFDVMEDCWFCGVSGVSGDLDDLDWHDEDCAYRRARRWVATHGGQP